MANPLLLQIVNIMAIMAQQEDKTRILISISLKLTWDTLSAVLQSQLVARV